jgi:hypothetical protein
MESPRKDAREKVTRRCVVSVPSKCKLATRVSLNSGMLGIQTFQFHLFGPSTYSEQRQICGVSANSVAESENIAP